MTTKEVTKPENGQDERIRAQNTKRKGMSGRGNFGADAPAQNTLTSGKGAQHHRSNKAGQRVPEEAS